MAIVLFAPSRLSQVHSPALATVDRLGVETALVVAHDEKIVALGVGVAEARDGRDVDDGMAREPFHFGRRLDDVAPGGRGIGQRQELLRRREVGAHLGADPPVDCRDQVVAEGARALAVGVVDDIGDGRDQHDHHHHAQHRQALTQRRAQARSSQPGRGRLLDRVRRGRCGGRLQRRCGRAGHVAASLSASAAIRRGCQCAFNGCSGARPAGAAGMPSEFSSNRWKGVTL